MLLCCSRCVFVGCKGVLITLIGNIIYILPKKKKKLRENILSSLDV